MLSAEPATSVYVSTSRDHPLHMWDAFTGELRATYRAYDHLDEVVAANSVCFNTAGDKIFAGVRTPLDSNAFFVYRSIVDQHDYEACFALTHPTTLSRLRRNSC